MKCLDDIDAMVTAMQSGWPIGIKALQTLRAQIVADIGYYKRACELKLEARNPQLVLEEPE